jgi:predicted amidohydrolase
MSPAPGGETYHNALPLISPDGEILGVYRKTHLFDAPNRVDIPPGIMESKKVTAGGNLDVYGTNCARIGLSVCSDLRFPEVYREMTLNGAEVLICASAFLSPRFDHWEFFLRARAAENQTYVIASGQYGVEPKSGVAFVGRSMIVDPLRRRGLRDRLHRPRLHPGGARPLSPARPAPPRALQDAGQRALGRGI